MINNLITNKEKQMKIYIVYEVDTSDYHPVINDVAWFKTKKSAEDHVDARAKVVEEHYSVFYNPDFISFKIREETLRD